MFQRLFGRKQNDPNRAEPQLRGATGDLKTAGVELDNCTFSVVDVETTGLFPQAHHRIVEIAIVKVRPNGQILDEFVTLVNPERDIGPTHIHGITARDVLKAPRFDNIAGDVISRLAGSILVAHNARFDVGFLEAEFGRIGHMVPPLAALCTMTWAKKVDASPPAYRLAALCEYFDIPLKGAHSALGDARATAALLQVLLDEARKKRWHTLADLGCTLQPAPLQVWPRLPTSGLVHTRELAASAPVDPPYLAGLIDRLVTTPLHHDVETLEYVDLLDRVLEDRRVTEEEADALLDLAMQWGFSSEQVRIVHQRYLEALVATALEDGIITDTERRDLDQVAELLGYDSVHLSNLVLSAEWATAGRPRVETVQAPSSQESLAGLSVCFTGESRCTFGGELILRDRAEQLATEAGLTVKSTVTKSLDLLVVADPHSLSGKAQKAGRYGIRIMTEAVFWRSLGINVD